MMEKEGHQSVVCYGRGSRTYEANVYKCCSEFYSKFNNLLSRCTGLMYGGCWLSTTRLIQYINKEKPDVVHIHCVNGYFVNVYHLISFLKMSGVMTVLTLHAEFMYTGNCGVAIDCNKWKTGCGSCLRYRAETKSLLIDNTHASWEKMKKAFEGFDNLVVVSVSPWLQNRAASAPILHGKKHVSILNGIDTSIFNTSAAGNILIQEFGVQKKIVFHATSMFSDEKEHNKGGYYVIEIAKRFWAERKDVLFLVAGKCRKIRGLPPNIILLGDISDQSVLANYYSAADVTLLTSRVETFSMIVAESLCCGTPVVGFQAGAPEMIAIKEFSSFVPYGKIDEIIHELKTVLFSKKTNRECVSTASIRRFAKEIMIEQYQEIYRRMMDC